MAISVATPVYDRKNESVRHFLKQMCYVSFLFLSFSFVSIFQPFHFYKEKANDKLKKD